MQIKILNYKKLLSLSTLPLFITSQSPIDMFQCIENYELKVSTKKVNLLREEWKKENPIKRPLFEAYPTLQSNLPHVELTELNTPLHKLEEVSNDLQTNIFIKRDDKIGNKTRKAEFLLADAKQKSSSCIFTVGGIGSNHATTISEYAQKIGLECKIFLMEQPNSYGVKKKLLTNFVNQAEIVFCNTADLRSENLINYALNYKKNKSEIPYFITTGGSNKIGTIGYVNAAFELKNQLSEQNLPIPDYIFVAAGSYGTYAGLLVGLKAVGINTQLIGVLIEPCNTQEQRNIIHNLADDTVKYLHSLDKNFPKLTFSYEEIILEDKFEGSEYGLFTKEGINAIKYLKEKENILLDGTYTGKAFAALLHKVKNSPDVKGKNILFINTYKPIENGILNKVDYKKLPKNLHRFFESPVQELDSLEIN